MQQTEEMHVWSLGREDPLQENMATHSRILAWRIPWTEEPSGLQFMGSQRVGHDWSELAHRHSNQAADVNNGKGVKARPLGLILLYYPFRGRVQVAQWWSICLPMQETQETRVQSLRWEDPLEEEMANRSSILGWKIPWTEKPGRL